MFILSDPLCSSLSGALFASITLCCFLSSVNQTVVNVKFVNLRSKVQVF